MKEIERKFVVNAEGEAKVLELTEEEKQELNKKSKILVYRQNRTFVVDKDGTVTVQGDGKKKFFEEDEKN